MALMIKTMIVATVLKIVTIKGRANVGWLASKKRGIVTWLKNFRTSHHASKATGEKGGISYFLHFFGHALLRRKKKNLKR